MTRRLLVSLLVLSGACSGDSAPPSTDGLVADQLIQVDGPVAGMETAPPQPDQGADASPGPTFDGKPGEFVKTADGRTYRLLVPSGYTHAKPIPLLLGFHGAGDSGANFYSFCKYVGWAKAAAPAHFALLIPDTKSPYKDFAIWSGNPSNDMPQMKQEMAEIIAIVKDVGQHYNLDTKQIHPFGFSDGGLFVAVAGLDRSDYFASLTITGYGWGGSYLGGTPSRKIAVQFVVGSTDKFASYAQSSESFLKGKGHKTRLLLASGVGHKFSGLMQNYPPADIFGWMQQHPLP